MEHINQSMQTAMAESTSKLIRNTYTLLSMTLFFSALMAVVSMQINPPPMVSMVCSIGAIGLLWFVLPRTANSTSGIFVTFAFTGMLGFGLGPMLNAYLALPNGSEVIATAMGGTGIIFLGISAYALTSKRDFSFMGGFLAMGVLVLLLAAIAGIFLQMPALQIGISAGFILIFSGFILYDTSRMVKGHETNYIIMTASLYLSIYNIFVSLLQILGIAGGDD